MTKAAPRQVIAISVETMIFHFKLSPSPFYGFLNSVSEQVYQKNSISSNFDSLDIVELISNNKPNYVELPVRLFWFCIKVIISFDVNNI